jgi:hypothetical protein
VNAGAVPLDKKGQPRTPKPYSGPSGPSLEAHGSGIERIIPAELPPGEYVVDVSLTVQQGDATYYFRIIVE